MLCQWSNARILDLSWSMCLYSTSQDIHVSGSIARGGAWEGHLVTPMIKAMRAHPNSTLLDVGGNIGFYTLAAAKAGFDVHVFEPVPRNAEMIRASVKKNHLQDNVQLHTCALSDASGELAMGESVENQGGVSHRKVSNAANVNTRIPAFRLDDILLAEKRPLYLKLDIEGSECAAFRGMMQYLQNAKRIIGTNMEFRGERAITKECCPKWTASGGVFDILHTKHDLCPKGMAYDNVCASNEWDLLWIPCSQSSVRG